VLATELDLERIFDGGGDEVPPEPEVGSPNSRDEGVY
jgi:hypothetical protein